MEKLFRDLVMKNRSYRRYYEEKRISYDKMVELVDLGHMTPSAANKQPVRYVVVNSEEMCSKVFCTLGWAGYLKDWSGPEKGERPSGYIVLLSPENINCMHDEGIIGQTILLGAVDMGMAGCFVGNINREELAQLIRIPEGYAISLVVALGYPKEEVVIDHIRAEGDVKYYRDNENVHHVPKIILNDVIVGRF